MKKLYIGGLSYSTSEEGLRNAFAQVGAVESASVIFDKMSGRSKGFGFVEMGTDEEAAKAIAQLNNTELDGRSITVAEARPMTDRPRTGGAGGGGFNRGGGSGAGGGGGRRDFGGGGGGRGGRGF